MSGVSVFMLILIGLLFIYLVSGYYLSNLVIKKKSVPEPKLHSHLKEYLPEGEWEKIYDKFDKADKTKFDIDSPFGYTLTGYAVHNNKASDSWVIISHGVTASKTRSLMYADIFSKFNFNYVIYDHRCHGGSTGKYISYGFYERYDMKVLVDEIKELYSPDIIGIHGESMGSGIALMYAGSVEDGVDFYVLDCPYDDFYEEMKFQINKKITLPALLRKLILKHVDLFITIRTGFSLKEVCPIKYVQNIQNPILFINCRDDNYIPPYMTQNLFDKKSEGEKSIYWVDQGGHAGAFKADPKQYKLEIFKFLNEVTEK